MFKKISLFIIILVILVMGVLRFWKLDMVPDGYHVDEVSGAVTMNCYATQGCDAEARPWPLFGFIQYGQDKPPTYIYPGLVWAKFFGTTVPSFRGYGVFGLTMGLVGLFFLARTIIGGWGFGLITVLAAACSPWMWCVSRVLMESYFAPVFVIWGLYFFWRSSRWWDWALAGFFFACAMYSYPPARLQVPLMMITLWVYEYGRRSFRWQSVLSLVVAFFLSLLPLAANYIYASLSRRFDIISIFNKDYLHSLGSTGTPWDITRIFFHNYLLHLSPDFLFMTGDPSYVHSTRHLGIFSYLDMAALGVLAVFLVIAIQRRSWSENPVIKNRRLLIFLAVNFFIGIIPSALTNQELPHALRICGSWPMMMLFTGLMWYSAAECFKVLWPAVALLGILCGGVLSYQYFVIYPQASRGMFDFWIKETAEKMQTQQDWQQFLLTFHRRNYHCRYFMVNRLGMTCKQANDIWWKLHDDLAKQGLW